LTASAALTENVVQNNAAASAAAIEQNPVTERDGMVGPRIERNLKVPTAARGGRYVRARG
jgi:hypothetical protein